MRLSTGIRATVGLALLTIPATAQAGHGVLPRSLVVWNDTPCVDFVDRSVDPVLELDYDISFEDTGHTANEVDDSRTMQFLAICRQHAAQEPLPNWIAWADVDDAASIGLFDSSTIADDDVLETNAPWADCWTRITADDARRPITEAQAAMPVAWDTSALPAGDYVVEGYTYMPQYNAWSERTANVVRVHDGGDPATDRGPAASVETVEDTNLYVGSKLPVAGCVDALPGSTLTASYADADLSSTGDWNPQWVPFAQDVAIDGDSFSVDFVPPEEAGMSSVAIQVVVTDPMDRTYTAYRFHLLYVIAGTNPNACDTGGMFIADPGCAGSSSGGAGPTTGMGGGATTTGSAGTTTTDGSSEGSSSGNGESTADSSGCGCRSGGSNPRAAWLGVGLLALVYRRRRG